MVRYSNFNPKVGAVITVRMSSSRLPGKALKKINEMVNSGQAAEKFEKMVSSLGGSSKILSNYKKELKQK